MVKAGHLDADYRKFDMYVMARVKYAEVDRKLKQVTEIMFQHEGFTGNLATTEADKAKPEPTHKTATTDIKVQQDEDIAKDSTTEGEAGEPDLKPVDDPCSHNRQR